MSLLLIALSPADAAQGAGFAQTTGLPFDILLLTGTGTADLGAQTVHEAGLTIEPTADAAAAAIQPLCAGRTHIAAVSAMWSKDLLARLAGLASAPLVTDAISWEDGRRFRRPIVAGSVIATVEVHGDPVFVTFRPGNFPKANLGGTSAIQSVALNAESKAERTEVRSRSGGRPDLTQAKVIVSGGRPLQTAEAFERVIGGLADTLGGAAGATRAAVDSGIAANELQVGQTGKIVAPDLYIAAGISGSTQHMAGIKDSKLIVAINKDGDAPIFEFADIGLVADLYPTIEELQALLK